MSRHTTDPGTAYAAPQTRMLYRAPDIRHTVSHEVTLQLPTLGIAMRIRSGLLLALLSLLTAAQTCPASDLILDLGDEPDESVVRAIAGTIAVSGNGLGYRSTQAETQTLYAVFTPRRDTTRLMVLSDDGLDLWIRELPPDQRAADAPYADDDHVLKAFEKPQRLEVLEESLLPVTTPLTAGRRYGLKIRYSNLGDGPAERLSGLIVLAYHGGVTVEGQLLGVHPHPAIVPVSAEITFRARGSHLAATRWSSSGNPSTATGTGATLTTAWGTPGRYELIASLNGSTVTVPVSVVTLEQIRVFGTRQPSPQVIPRHSPLVLEAVASGGLPFPDGTPQWMIRLPAGVTPGPESHLRRYPRVGRTLTFISDSPGVFELFAACGSTSQTFTIEVVDIPLHAGDDEYYLAGNSQNDTLSDTSPLKVAGKSTPAPDGPPRLSDNDTPMPLPDSIQFELRSGPRYAESFQLDPATGAFTYKPRDIAAHRWIRKTRDWATDDNPENDVLLRPGQPPLSWFHGDAFVYRLKTKWGSTELTSNDAVVRIYPPRFYQRRLEGEERTSGLGGLALVGGGETAFDSLFRWIVHRAQGGDVVILKTGGDSAWYTDELSHLKPLPNSVTTLVVSRRDDADREDWAAAVTAAESILIVGDDPGRWIAVAKDTRLGRALAAKATTWSNADGCAISGSGAGLHLLGSIDDTGVRGLTDSVTVLRNPRHFSVTELTETPGPPAAWQGVSVADESFLNVQPGLLESQVQRHNRLGRWLVLLARKNQGGIAVDELTAYIQEPGAPPRVLEESVGGVFLATPPERAAWDRGGLEATVGVTRRQLQRPAVQPYVIRSRAGTLSSTAEAGQIYGSSR